MVLVLHTYVLRVQISCGVLVLVFWFWREIVFGVTYILSVQYTCAVGCVSFLVVGGNSVVVGNSCVVVSVFWLWREIVLKMRKPFEFLLGYFIMIR